jgi:hypothetical protein
MKFKHTFWSAVLSGLLLSGSLAQIVDVNFSGGGSTSYSAWSNLTASNYSGYGTFPGNSPWPAPILATDGSTSASLNRIAGSPTGGGPYLGNASIYFGNFAQIPNALGGTLQVSNNSPLSNLRTLVFQLQIGEATGFDFHQPTGFPLLSINGEAGQTALFTNLVTRFQNGTFPSPETGQDEPVWINTWAYQWNLTDSPVSSYALNFSAVTHAQVYALRVDGTSVLQSAAVVPEPGVVHLLALGGLVLFVFLARKRRHAHS